MDDLEDLEVWALVFFFIGVACGPGMDNGGQDFSPGSDSEYSTTNAIVRRVAQTSFTSSASPSESLNNSKMSLAWLDSAPCLAASAVAS